MMARTPFHVLVFPYRYTDEGQLLYAVFFRDTDRRGDFWQAISGGVEDDETPLQAARRESQEEAGLSPELDYFQLDSTATIPVQFVSGFLWGPDVLVVTEYAFGVRVDSPEIVLSHEHIEYRWVDYEGARELLRHDSNTNALWELNHRLLNGKNE